MTPSPDIQAKLQWEHVGSTSIKGMPGTMHPDSLILLQSFPPPKELVESLMANGYHFIGPGTKKIKYSFAKLFSLNLCLKVGMLPTNNAHQECLKLTTSGSSTSISTGLAPK